MQTNNHLNNFPKRIVTYRQDASASERFKAHLKKIGSGINTSHGMSREESAEAMNLMIREIASPAQIGAFMIAHRIRRPEPQELAGMLDTYLDLGPTLKSSKQQVRPVCLGMPFDGRTRTSPIYPLTTLMLLTAGQPVVLQGGKRMPIKYGITTEELFRSLGLNLKGMNINQVQQGFEEHGLAFIYQPDHFPLAENLINYRDEIAKRPPIASMELIWTAHQGKHLLVSGFVHPPTETRSWETLKLIGEKHIVTIKGLEGSIDLPTSRICITARLNHNELERIILNPRDYNYSQKDLEWSTIQTWKQYALDALKNSGPLREALAWNTGVYLWLSGQAQNIKSGIDQAISLMNKKAALNTLQNLIDWRNRMHL